MTLDKTWFLNKINSFLSDDISNKMTHVDGSFMFRPEALVGFASGDDPIFEDYKKIIGKFHLTPNEAFKWHYSERGITESFNKLSVVA